MLDVDLTAAGAAYVRYYNMLLFIQRYVGRVRRSLYIFYRISYQLTSYRINERLKQYACALHLFVYVLIRPRVQCKSYT